MELLEVVMKEGFVPWDKIYAPDMDDLVRRMRCFNTQCPRLWYYSFDKDGVRLVQKHKEVRYEV